MKRIIRPLLILALAAAMVGCSDNRALRLRYEAEKKLHDAEKVLSIAQIDPRTVSAEQIERARSSYEDAAHFAVAALDSVSRQAHPVEYRELQTLALQASLTLNHLLYSQRRYGESITELSWLLGRSELAPDELMVVRVNLGRSLQASGQWDSAVAVYTTAVEEFYPPLNSKGELVAPLFNLPGHIFGVVAEVGDSVAAAYEFQRAVTYYSELAEKHPGTPIETSSRAALARLYDVTRQWRQEIAQLTALSDTSSPQYVMIRSRIAEIYGLRLREFPRALVIFDSLLAKVSPKDTAVFPNLLLKKAMVRLEQKDYAGAREILTGLKNDYRMFFGSMPSAQLAMARTFELEGRWDRAEVEYSALIEGYRGSDEAMAALLYVARHYEKEGQRALVERWYRDAAEYYAAVRQADAGGLNEARAMGYEAELAARKGDWQGAARTFLDIFRKFPRHEVGRQAIMKAAELHRDKLAQPAVADSLLAELKASLTEIETSPRL